MRLNKHKIFLNILILVMLVLSWSDYLDSLSSNINFDTIGDGIIIYAVARTINGSISIIQTAEVSALFASVQIGQVLDPLNDFIERFSSIMTWALGSLFLQKILLGIFNSFIFKYFFTACSIITLIFLFFKKFHKYWSTICYFFITIVFLRFSICILSLITGLIDYSFLKEIENEKMIQVKSFESLLYSNTEMPKLKTSDTLNKNLENILENISGTERLIDSISNEINLLPKRTWLEFFKGKEKDNNLQKLEKRLFHKNELLDKLFEEKEKLEKDIDCSLNNDCEGFFLSMKDKITNNNPVIILEKISNEVDETISNLFTIMASLVLKTLVLPLIFLFSLLKVFKLLQKRFTIIFQNEMSLINKMKK